jgi:hypothetical protein
MAPSSVSFSRLSARAAGLGALDGGVIGAFVAALAGCQSLCGCWHRSPLICAIGAWRPIGLNRQHPRGSDGVR